MSHASMSHAAHEATAPVQQAPVAPRSPDACPWVLGCSGMMQLAFEASWRVLESAPAVAAPVGVTLRPAMADRDVESPPPRA